ncbi:MAG: hypothetical protein BWY06_00221 [Candidatus Latescibacteria bacterium ADurb.Bin168]|nr:MAG: hypothetical protein BWY06_00221 [Candidatus Latescibacteria bacterium ADurb.Bin168]
MRIWRHRFLTAPVIVIAAWLPARAVYLPLDNRAYEDLDALALRGYRVVPATTIKPYSRKKVAEGLARLSESRADMSAAEREMYDRLRAEFAHDVPDGTASPGPASENRWWLKADVNPRAVAQTADERTNLPRARRLPATRRTLNDRARLIGTLDLTFRLTSGLSTFQRLEMDTDGLWDNDFRGHRVYGEDWGMFNATGQVEEAYITYENGWGSVGFGRIQRMWGPERQGSIFLSDNAPAMDMLSADVHLNWLHFSWITAELEPEQEASGTPISRYYAGHRLVLTPFRWAEVGLSECVIYGGTNQGFSLRWSNPFVFLYGEEVNINPTNENLLVGADISLRPIPNTEFYGAFLIDDVSIDKPKLAPDRIAWSAGARWEAPFGVDRLGTGAEYVRLSRWVYNYARIAPWRHYVNKNAVLGSFLGPDGDALFLEGRWVTQDGTAIKGLLSHRRQGETRYSTPTPNYVPSDYRYPCEPFPFGIVEKRTSLEAIVEFPSFYGASVSGGLFGSATLNKDNKKAPRHWGWGLRLDVDWHLPVRW